MPEAFNRALSFALAPVHDESDHGRTEPADRLLTSKRDIAATRSDTRPTAALADGEALLAVERFALTANNLTYAAFGDAMRYWDFFPTDEPGWGLMPVWGFARVVDSTVPELQPGERFYGYFPMADSLRVRPGRFSERGFYDLSAHRKPLPSPYNQYTRCATDPAHVPELEAYQMLLRPLFFTSYMLADFLQDNAFFGAQQLLISSASSKTAYGTAYCLHSLPTRPRLVALTSERNRAFVEGLGVYDAVHTYDGVGGLPSGVATAYVDFSGRAELRQSLHAHFGAALAHDCYAGSAANFDYLTDADRYDPAPQAFFAPTQIRKRNGDWGPELLAERVGAAQRSFLRAVSDPAKGWLRIEQGHGYAAAARVITRLCESGGEADVGYTIAL